MEKHSDSVPANTRSESERGRWRLRRIGLTAFASIGFRGAMMLSGLIYIPLTVRYLGPERYGLWVAITSVMTLLVFADCGIGYGLMNHVAHSSGQGATEEIRRSISSTFAVLVTIALAGCGVFAFAYPLIPWQAALRTRTPGEAAAASAAIAVMVVSFLLTLPFTTVQRVQAGYQEGFETQFWEIGGVAFSLAGLLVAIRMRAGLPVLAVIFALGPLLALVLNWITYFGFRRRSLMPAFGLLDFGLARSIVHEGIYFFILQLGGIFVFSLDSFIVLHYFGQAELASYSLVAKLFSIAPAFAGGFFAALWPAYGEAIARGDMQWVRHTLRRSVMLASVFCAAGAFGAAVFAAPIIRIWTGAIVHPSIGLLAGFTVLQILIGGTSAIAAYWNGSKFIRGQAGLVLINVVVCVILKVALSRTVGVSGVVWATNLGYFLVIIPGCLITVPRLMHKQVHAVR